MFDSQIRRDGQLCKLFSYANNFLMKEEVFEQLPIEDHTKLFAANCAYFKYDPL